MEFSLTSSRRHLAIIALTVILGGCASNSTSPETAVEAGLPPNEPQPEAERTVLSAAQQFAAVPSGMARIVIFRGYDIGILSNIMKPDLKVNGQPVGKCDQDSVVVHDVAPGSYKVSMQTDMAVKSNVTLSEGQIAYIKCNILPIGLFLPAPKLERVEAARVPERISALPIQ